MSDVVRWGVLGSGPVAHLFAQGLQAVPGAVISAAFSRTEARARHFAARFNVDRWYADSSAFLADDKVDVVYIATPNQRHKSDMLAALGAGKPVLCEKPFTVDAAEAREVVARARSAKLFCMEAMWMRFLPLMRQLPSVLPQAGKIGLMHAQLGHAFQHDAANRLFDPNAGGGATLDLGVYLVSLAVQCFGAPLSVTARGSLGPSGVDEQMSALLTFRDGQIASLSASLRGAGSNAAVFLGDRARIEVHEPLYRASELTVTRFEPMSRVVEPPAAGFRTRLKSSQLVRALYQRSARLAPELFGGGKRSYIGFSGNGYNYQAEEVMRCLRAGLTESATMPLDETVLIMSILDSIRSDIAEAAQ